MGEDRSSTVDAGGRGLGLRRAVLAVLSVVLCVGAVWAFADRELRSRRVDDRRRQVEQLRDQELASLEAWADDLVVDARYWASDPVIVERTAALLATDVADLRGSPALADVRSRLQGFVELNGIRGFFVVGVDGTTVASMREVNIGTTNLVAEHHPEAFAEIVDGAARLTPPQPSDVPISADLQDVETMFAAAPIRADDDVVAVLMLRIVPTVDLAPLARIGGAIPGFGWFVVSENGDAVTGFDDVEPLDPVRLHGQPAADVLGSEPVGSNLSPGASDEVDRIEAWAVSPEVGLGIVAVYDGDEAFAELRSERRGYLLVALLTAIVGSVLVLAAYQMWDRYRSREDLEAMRRRFRALVEPSPDVMIRVRRDGTVLGANEAGEALIEGDGQGRARWQVLENHDEVPLASLADRHPLLRAIALEWGEVADQADPGTIERVRVVVDDVHTYHRLRFVPLDDADGEVLVVVTDVTPFAEREIELERLSRVDPLTGLGNRRAIFERLEEALSRLDRVARPRAGVAVLMIDLDHFKQVNDDLGHAAGDAVLVETARSLSAALRGHDAVGRVGGDEFMIVCERVGGTDDAERLAERISLRLSGATVDVDGTRVSVVGRVGLAWTREAVDAADLVHRADEMLLAAKRDRAGPLFLVASPPADLG